MKGKPRRLCWNRIGQMLLNARMRQKILKTESGRNRKQDRLLDHAMITDKSIHRFCSIALIVCSVAALGLSFYFGDSMILVWMLLAAIFIFAANFVM